MKEDEPLVDAVPPVETVNQSMVSPAPGVALNETVPVPQLEPAVPVGAVGKATVAVTAVLVADKQPVVEFLASA